MTLADCRLVHHTGTMIRFRTSQLPVLPPKDVDVYIRLPDDNLVAGHFRRNPANPNITGPALVRYIKGRIPFGSVREAVIEFSSAGLWRLLEAVADTPVLGLAKAVSEPNPESPLSLERVGKILAWSDEAKSDSRRAARYGVILRPPQLRKLVLRAFGSSCQVDDCRTSEDYQSWGGSVITHLVDVHHIEPLACVVDHSPFNLCVLCANHHRLVHSASPWSIAHDGDDVALHSEHGTLWIRRDLSVFREDGL